VFALRRRYHVGDGAFSLRTFKTAFLAFSGFDVLIAASACHDFGAGRFDNPFSVQLKIFLGRILNVEFHIIQ
jgi:hypothetical protein